MWPKIENTGIFMYLGNHASIVNNKLRRNTLALLGSISCLCKHLAQLWWKVEIPKAVNDHYCSGALN